MDSKLVEDVGARIEFIKLALKHCGKCQDKTCSACGFYETELGILKRCLESRRWIPVSESLPETYRRVLVQIKYADSPAVASLDKDGDWVADTEHVECEGGWDGCVINSAINNREVTHWLPIPQ